MCTLFEYIIITFLVTVIGFVSDPRYPMRALTRSGVLKWLQDKSVMSIVTDFEVLLSQSDVW